jgi:hypothetical protein
MRHIASNHSFIQPSQLMSNILLLCLTIQQVRVWRGFPYYHILHPSRYITAFLFNVSQNYVNINGFFFPSCK